MTRIAVIGNSHSGPLLWSWQEYLEKARPDIHVEFFRGHTIALREMTVTPHVRFGCVDVSKDDPELMVHAMKYNMRLSIDLSTFDVVIPVGWWNVDAELIPSLLSRFGIDGLSTTASTRHLSEPAFDAIISAHTLANVPPPVWHDWKTPRVLHVSMPRRNQTAFETAPYRTMDRDALALAWDRASRMFAARMADVGIKTVPQPAETIADHGLTYEKFGRDPASMLHRSKPDYAHMNAAYGALLWRDIFAAVGA